MLQMPIIGLGTWKLSGKECERVISLAFELGYRHFDTADVYQNHEAIGRAIQSLPREAIYLTTKIAMKDLAPEKIKKAVDRFLKELKTDYLDLLLIHWPDEEADLAKALETMAVIQTRKLVHSIGVSNFVRSHLKEVAPFHFPILTNQIEMHPYLQRKQLVAACKKLKIAITAYRPLAKGAFEEDPTLNQIGQVHGKSASQIALKWLVEQGIAVIPKASSRKHLKDNLNLFDFELSLEDMKCIEKLDQGKRFCAPEGFPILED